MKESGIGYPSMSAHEQIRSGEGVMAIEKQLPDDLEAVQAVVNESPKEYRVVLIEHYSKDGELGHKATNLQLDIKLYKKRKDMADKYVAGRL